MKKTLKLIPAIAMLLISAVLVSTSTYAWFSMNKTVTASGMKVKAVAEGSIIITSTAALPADGTKATDYNFNDASATALYASTHDGDYTTYANGLKRVNNAENINPDTGVAKNSTATLTYESAVNATPTLYYRDYAVFIAGDGQAFEHQDLTITLEGSWLTPANTINKAISIDFYGESVTSKKDAECIQANYLGTLNVAGLVNNVDGKSTTAKTSVVVSDITIPKTGTTAAYAVTMRVFFDGALIETGGSQPYTLYEAATGTGDKCDSGKYYYTDSEGSSIATVVAGTTPVTGLYQVKSTSTYTFARTTSVLNIQDVTLVATFTASTHT